MSEHLEQVALIQWIEWNAARYPLLEQIYAIPNGSLRNKKVGKDLKAEGVRAGELDLNLDIACRGYFGWRGELKVGKNKPTDKQIKRLIQHTENGYFAGWFVGWDEMLKSLLWYIGVHHVKPEERGFLK